MIEIKHLSSLYHSEGGILMFKYRFALNMHNKTSKVISKRIRLRK